MTQACDNQYRALGNVYSWFFIDDQQHMPPPTCGCWPETKGQKQQQTDRIDWEFCADADYNQTNSTLVGPRGRKIAPGIVKLVSLWRITKYMQYQSKYFAMMNNGNVCTSCSLGCVLPTYLQRVITIYVRADRLHNSRTAQCPAKAVPHFRVSSGEKCTWAMSQVQLGKEDEAERSECAALSFYMHFFFQKYDALQSRGMTDFEAQKSIPRTVFLGAFS